MVEKTSVNELLLIKLLTKIIGRPEFVLITKLLDKLSKNAVAMDFDAGSCNHRLLRMMVSPARYINYSAMAFVMTFVPLNVPAIAACKAHDAR